jgi:class 3 adenylate cyclase/tetratricopeptide (TPR) repeat protein
MEDFQTATILVTDLVASTELRVRVGEERADQLRRIHDDLLRAAILDNRGTLVKGTGDGILAIFASAADGVAAAVSVQQVAYAHTRATPEQPFEIRIGLSAGDVSLEDDDCFGTPVIEASRLCGVAVGGQILAAEVVRHLARGRGGHVFTAAGARELKGLPDPVPVVVVGWEPPAIEGGGLPFPARLATQATLPFSGRSEQKERLLHRWKEASGGERQVVLVSGEPGIGKTRLAAEVARAVYDQGGVVLFGRCDEDLGLGFQPFVEALEQVVSSGASAQSLGRYAGDLVRLIPDLGRRVSSLEPPLRSDPETEQYRLLDAVAAWLASWSSNAGVLLVLDDLHWAERPTLLLLRHLIRSPEPTRLLILATYRDTELDRTHPLAEMLADLRRESAVERLDLVGLDVAGVTELLANASDGRIDERAMDLAQLLWSETEGNPFFVEEIILSLVESGRIVQRDGVWTTDFEIADLGIPQGVREAVGRRLSRLSDEANAVLGLASVIGAAVDTDLLIELSDIGEQAVLDALDQATAAALFRSTPSGDFEFTHALVRSTLYDELSAARRIRRHRSVAEALERRDAADPAALAYHFRRAGNLDARASDYAAAAGDVALDQLAFDQAVTFFTQALEAAEDVGLDENRRCELAVRLGTAQRLAGNPTYRATLLEASRLAQDLGHSELLADAAVANDRGVYSVTGGLDQEKIFFLEAAIAALGPEDSPKRARLMASLAGELVWHDPQLRRFELADQALAMARRLQDERCLIEVWQRALFATRFAERVPAQLEAFGALLELSERVGDASSICLVCYLGVLLSMEMGDLELASRLVARTEEAAAETNNYFFLGLAATSRCTYLSVTGTGDEVERVATDALANYNYTSRAPEAFAAFAVVLWFARGMQGRLDEIIEFIRQAAVEHPLAPVFNAALAASLSRIGEHVEAAAIASTLLASPSEPIVKDHEWLSTHAYLAEAVAKGGTPEEAAGAYQVLAPYAGQIPVTGGGAFGSLRLLLANLASRAGWPERAEELFTEAYEENERFGAHIWLARTQLEWGRFLLDHGEADHARTLLAEAREGARNMGAADVAREADALLGE